MGGGGSDNIIRELAAQLHEELDASRLVVLKWRSGDGWVRGPVSQNPPWYQQLCGQYLGRRRRYPKPRTIIRRVDVLRVLKRISLGITCRGLYYERLMDVIRDECESRGLTESFTEGIR